jgi:hypothetical protein
MREHMFQKPETMCHASANARVIPQHTLQACGSHTRLPEAPHLHQFPQRMTYKLILFVSQVEHVALVLEI